MKQEKKLCVECKEKLDMDYVYFCNLCGQGVCADCIQFKGDEALCFLCLEEKGGTYVE